MGPLWVALSGYPEPLALPGNHCSGTNRVIKLRKAHLQGGKDLEEVRKKRKLDFWAVFSLPE